MSGVRVLVGTAKGAFILTSDERRQKWNVEGPIFAGWTVYHIKGSPINPNRLYASQCSDWFGQVMQRSDDAGKTWYTPSGEPIPDMTNPNQGVSNKFVYEGNVGTHMWYDGTPHPWEFKRIWHLEPSYIEEDTVYAGAEDAALFVSKDGAVSWKELPGLREQRGSEWSPGAGGLGLHTILLDPNNPKRIYIAISAAGAFRTDDGGVTWKPINRGLRSRYIPDEDAEIGHCVHNLAFHPSRPDVVFMQLHWNIMRTDNAGDLWTNISGNLPTDFGFPIEVHAHEPETIYVVPIQSDSEHFVHEGKLRVFRSRTGGMDWEPLSDGLPQRDCYVNVLRDAMAKDTLDECGIYFGTTGGQVYVSPDGGDHWITIVRDLPRVLSVEVQTLT
jgi:hypothetical protein